MFSNSFIVCKASVTFRRQLQNYVAKWIRFPTRTGLVSPVIHSHGLDDIRDTTPQPLSNITVWVLKQKAPINVLCDSSTALRRSRWQTLDRLA